MYQNFISKLRLLCSCTLIDCGAYAIPSPPGNCLLGRRQPGANNPPFSLILFRHSPLPTVQLAFTFDLPAGPHADTQSFHRFGRLVGRGLVHGVGRVGVKALQLLRVVGLGAGALVVGVAGWWVLLLSARLLLWLWRLAAGVWCRHFDCVVELCGSVLEM